MDGAATPNASSDEAAVVAVALDYFEGWFDGDVERMDRALHPDLVKRSPGEQQGATLGITTKDRMLELTAAGEGAEDGADRRLDVKIEDVYGDVASVTVRSAVYHEYLHLVRTRDGWKIANALWRPT
jgi:ketosteroid isomerase-like protein